jgi:hypothetical protein
MISKRVLVRLCIPCEWVLNVFLRIQRSAGVLNKFGASVLVGDSYMCPFSICNCFNVVDTLASRLKNGDGDEAFDSRMSVVQKMGYHVFDSFQMHWIDSVFVAWNVASLMVCHFRRLPTGFMCILLKGSRLPNCVQIRLRLMIELNIDHS